MGTLVCLVVISSRASTPPLGNVQLAIELRISQIDRTYDLSNDLQCFSDVAIELVA